MKDWQDFYWGAAGGVVSVILGACIERHPEPSPLPSYCYSEEALTEAHKRCSAVSASREESQACGLAVDRLCGLAPVKP